MSSPRTLVVFCTGGLGNRLRVLLSARAIAEATDRVFTMLWPRTPACGAAFRHLFEDEWPVTDVAELQPSVLALRIWGEQRRVPDLLVDPRPEILLGFSAWLIRPSIFSGHDRLHARCVALLGELRPLPEIARRVEKFRARRFRPTMIGVHLRRADYVRFRPDLARNTRSVLAAVDRLLVERPDAGILLCTDDGAVDPWDRPVKREGVHEIFRARYGARLVETEPTLDRRKPEAIQDALVDMLLLRVTDAFVGTAFSSFSELAALGRTVPIVQLGEPTLAYRRLRRVARLTGAYWVLGAAIRARYGSRSSGADAWRLAHQALTRRLRRVWRW